jgi:hypothetical protein
MMLAGAPVGTPAFLVYKEAWHVVKDGTRLQPEDLQPHFQRLQEALQEVVNVFEEDAREEEEEEEDDPNSMDIESRKEKAAEKRLMFYLTEDLSKKVTSNPTGRGVQKLRKVNWKQSSAAERQGEQEKLNLSTTEDRGSKKTRAHESGLYSPDIDLLLPSILEAWKESSPQETQERGGDNLWFLYLLNALLKLVETISGSQLQSTLASILSFNCKAQSPPVDQCYHLDIDPAQLYPSLVQLPNPDDDEDWNPTLSNEELQASIENGECYYPSVWLFFVAFDHGHEIKVLRHVNGTNVIQRDIPSCSLVKTAYFKYFTDTLSFPFGSLGVVAGSVIHAGVGSVDYQRKPRFRMHSYCHALGRQLGLNVHDTYFWQKREED